MSHTIEHEGVVYKFEPLTIGQEDEWKDWVRDTAMEEAMSSSAKWPAQLRAEYLAAVSLKVPLDKCSFIGECGREKLATEKGVAKVLQMASLRHHPSPSVPEETIMKLINARPTECGRVMINVILIGEQAREAMLSEFEKKVGGQKDGQV